MTVNCKLKKKFIWKERLKPAEKIVKKLNKKLYFFIYRFEAKNKDLCSIANDKHERNEKSVSLLHEEFRRFRFLP